MQGVSSSSLLGSILKPFPSQGILGSLKAPFFLPEKRLTTKFRPRQGFVLRAPRPTSLFWRLVKAAVLVGHTPVLSQTGWHTEPCAMKRLLLLLTPLLVSANPVSAWERFDPDEGYKNCVDTALREWLDQEKWRSLNRVEKSAYKSLAHQRCNSSVPEQFQTDMGK